MFLKEHEKFIAFLLLGAALCSIIVLLIFHPIPNNSEATKTAVAGVLGALTLAFGNASQALFKISSSEKADIAAATATAMSAGPPLPTVVTNAPEEPVPTEDAAPQQETAEQEELPDYAR